MALGEAKGNRTRLENQLVALLAYAKSMFQKELALRRDQSEQRQAWLDQLSQHLRTQLETMPNGTPVRKPHGLQPASNLDRQNES
jgi:hypothetical protein